MKLIILLVAVTVLGFGHPLSANEGMIAPNQLAAMGLGGMDVLLDEESTCIRVRAYPPSRWGPLYPYVRGANRFEQQGRSLPGPIFRPTAMIRVRL